MFFSAVVFCNKWSRWSVSTGSYSGSKCCLGIKVVSVLAARHGSSKKIRTLQTWCCCPLCSPTLLTWIKETIGKKKTFKIRVKFVFKIDAKTRKMKAGISECISQQAVISDCFTLGIALYFSIFHFIIHFISLSSPSEHSLHDPQSFCQNPLASQSHKGGRSLCC